MGRVFTQLWRDDRGALIATEWVFVATILVVGLVVGLKAVQSAVLNELEEVAGAIGAISQSYSYGGSSGCCAFTSGSSFTDNGPNTYPVTNCTRSSDGQGTTCPD